MKRLLVLLILLLFNLNIANAQECDYKCPAQYDVTSNVSQFFSNITGQKFLTETVAESIVTKSIKKNLISGNINTEIKSFSAKDLKKGRFKSIEVSGRNVNAQGVYISSFKAKTLCDFNYITQDKNGEVIIKEDMPFAVKIVISEDDINNTMNSADYKRLVNDINSLGGNFNIFQINSTKVKLKNNRMYYIINYSMPFMRKTKDIVIATGLKVQNGKIKLADTSFENTTRVLDIDKFSNILNFINPLDFSAKILENKDAKFNIKTIIIEDNEIMVEGIITLLKDKNYAQ